MKILLIALNVFNTIGGGQTFIKNVASKNPDLEYYFFGESGSGVLQNLHAIPISDYHRSNASLFNLGSLNFDKPELSLAGKEDDIALMLDMAAAVAGMTFDAVEIPDFLPFGALAPMLLEAFGFKVKKIVLSMHGVLTLSIQDLWQGRNTTDLNGLRYYENLAYRIADTRYGISERYVGEWERETGFPGIVVDPLLSVELSAMTFGRRFGKPERGSVKSIECLPALNFVGRQDWIKGPDLFLSVAANLSPDSFGSINLYGSPVVIEGVNSKTVLNTMAERRALVIGTNEPISHAALFDIFANTRSITFVPSRVDTFNLVAIESLLNGCPTVISIACGICDYLDKVYPDLPYVKLDPDNIWAALPKIRAILDDYDEYRARLAQALAGRADRPAYGVPLADVYTSESTADRSAQAIVKNVARKLVQHINRAVRPRIMMRHIVETEATVRDGANGLGVTNISYLATPFLKSSTTVRAMLHREAGVVSMPSSERDDIRALTEVIANYRANRIPAYRLLANIERKRGNDLIYAVYNLRCFRTTGRVDRQQLNEVISVLENAGLKADAAAAKLLLTGDDEQVYAYLKSQSAAMRAPSEDGIEFIEHFGRKKENLRVAVLVSAYNAANKIPQFLTGLLSFVDSTIDALEVIIVDSGSTDCTSEAVRQELTGTDRPPNRLDVTLIRTRDRETIQSAWNRALVACRAPYITFLGVDEMMRPDSLEILSGYLDRCPSLDWVQGNAIVCEVNEHGSPIRDVMVYDRQSSSSTMLYLDCCYMSYVGGLYRRSIHDRAGYYNGSFRAAGDNEFKARALPMISMMSIPDLLGTFRNFQEVRTTESPIAELEDYRAWHLPRSVGGLRYAFEGGDPREPVELFLRCLRYRKSYMGGACTDVDFALTIADYLQKFDIDRFYQIQHYLPDLRRLQQAYRTFDEIATPGLSQTLIGCGSMVARTKEAFRAVSLAEHALAPNCQGATFTVINDNRYHQYQNVWKSRAQQLHLSRMLDFGDLAGPQDLAEVFSSCSSEDPEVDFESAWASGRLDQVKALFEENAIDFVLPLPGEDAEAQKAFAKAKDWFGRLRLMGRQPSLAVAGNVPHEKQLLNRKIYILGRCKTYRPVLAAAHCILLPYWDEGEVAEMTEAAVDHCASGKPIIIARPMWEAITSYFGGAELAREFSDAIAVCEDEDDLLQSLATFARRGSDERESIQRSSRDLATAIRRLGPRVVSDDPSATKDFPWLLEWDADFKSINNILRSYIEKSESHYDCYSTLGALLVSPAGLAKLKACINHIFVAGDAPILDTEQASFRGLRSGPAARSIKEVVVSLCGYFAQNEGQADKAAAFAAAVVESLSRSLAAE